MTAQKAEKLYYDGQLLSMRTHPLGAYFALEGRFPDFDSSETALGRGYVGTWEIVEGRLYLIDLVGGLRDGRTVAMDTFFPGGADRVFAQWYSGTLRVWQGKLLRYVHHGYASSYERDLLIEIENGVVTNIKGQQNGIATSDNAPQGCR
jgi:hypothetical protein